MILKQIKYFFIAFLNHNSNKVNFLIKNLKSYELGITLRTTSKIKLDFKS